MQDTFALHKIAPNSNKIVLRYIVRNLRCTVLILVSRSAQCSTRYVRLKKGIRIIILIMLVGIVFE